MRIARARVQYDRADGDVGQDVRVGVELVDQGQDLVLAGVGGQAVRHRIHAGRLGLLPLVTDIEGAGRIVADPQHRQARGAPGAGQAFGHHALQTLFDRGRQLAAIQTRGHEGRRARLPSACNGRASLIAH